MSKIFGATTLALVLGMASIPSVGLAKTKSQMARCPAAHCACAQGTTLEKGQPAPERVPDPGNEEQIDFLLPDGGD